MASERTILAAGGIVWRRRAGSRTGVEVLVAHRPRYDDWTFPKGKSEPGESLPVTAVREIEEETGFRVRLGADLPDVRYRVAAGPKVVSYWTARLVKGDPGRFVPNDEVDAVQWLRPRDAARRLTYAHDLDLLEHFRVLRDTDGLRTRTVVVLRHAKAQSRESFAGRDEQRPLADVGRHQACALAPVLSAFGITAVVTSPAVRCADTVAPFAVQAGVAARTEARFAEGSRPRDTTRAVREAIDASKHVVLCSHGPVLPDIFAVLGVQDPGLAPGHGVVVHRRGERVVASSLLG